MLVRFSFSLFFFLGSFCFTRPPVYTVSFKYGVGGLLVACVCFACVPSKFLGRCVLEKFMESSTSSMTIIGTRDPGFESSLGTA